MRRAVTEAACCGVLGCTMGGRYISSFLRIALRVSDDRMSVVAICAVSFFGLWCAMEY